MKKALIITAGILIVFYALAKVNAMQVENAFAKIDERLPQLMHDGDIIFQTSQSRQCEAVRIATNSKFSHCGIIYEIKGEKYVYEAVQPVKITPLADWISHGENNSYVVKRLKDTSLLTSLTLEKMKKYGSQFKNKDYDLYFEWSDAKIYCSELVWKIYKNGANIELCKLASLKSFNLTNPKVKEILAERYGNNIPLEEKVVAPSQIVDSELLETVIDTYN
ncbi:MAG TPA: YiiX family permuted papain-like enzyme, partial [Flavobacterium sp.]|nr:YiiX family permuted papain-like enzyme [Flavobacterium sp.]